MVRGAVSVAVTVGVIEDMSVVGMVEVEVTSKEVSGDGVCDVAVVSATKIGVSGVGLGWGVGRLKFDRTERSRLVSAVVVDNGVLVAATLLGAAEY